MCACTRLGMHTQKEERKKKNIREKKKGKKFTNKEQQGGKDRGKGRMEREGRGGGLGVRLSSVTCVYPEASSHVNTQRSSPC